MNSKGLVYTNDNCIGCNKCIRACAATGACIASGASDDNKIHVNPDKCIACGACMKVCEHDARRYNDDTDRFLEDLANGEQITLLVAPSFFANYPDDYGKILGGLKNLGVKRFINVAFGADITTWGYVNYLNNNDFTGGISQPCPVIVGYIERYAPSLIQKLFPIQSPLICAAVYARKYMGITDKLAFLSPCIAKKLEIEDPNTNGLVSYNVTFDHLMKRVGQDSIYGENIESELECGLGAVYPMPGGLTDNIKWFLDKSKFIRSIEGENRVFKYIKKNLKALEVNKYNFFMLDLLNCGLGCLGGKGCEADLYHGDEVWGNLLNIREKIYSDLEEKEGWNSTNSVEERVALLNKCFEQLDPDDFVRKYTDRSQDCKLMIPDEETAETIYLSMGKETQEERNINCSNCGYDTCEQMMVAIYNGFNVKTNCINYLRAENEKQIHEAMVAKASNEAKTQFLTSMSHEIRTPINGVLGMNAMILRDAKDPQILEYASNIRSAGRGLLAIVNDILDISKIESGTMEVANREYKLSHVISDSYHMVNMRAEEKHLKLKVINDTTIPNVLFGDEAKIRQIATNLLTNAIKYTKEGQIQFKISYSKIDEENINLKISVKDTGDGISKENQENLFNIFSRIDLDKNQNIEGTGLGLSICKRMIELMNGKIYVKSELGTGSEFFVEIPQKVVSFEKVGKFEDYAKGGDDITIKDLSAFRAPNARVLIVDDMVINLKVFEGLLRPSKMKIDKVTSGKEALGLIERNKYDVIFMDHMMPGMDGIETLHEIRANRAGMNYTTPVIVLTANAITGMRNMYLGEGFAECLFKPADPNRLLKVLKDFIPKEKIET